MADDLRVNFIRQLWVLVLAGFLLVPSKSTAFGAQFVNFFSPKPSARVYLNPNTGRFWTMDSYEGDNEDPLSLHKYLYCHGNPVNGIDPSGHDFDLISVMSSMYIRANLAAASFMTFHGTVAETALFVTALSFMQDYEQLSSAVDANGQPLTTFTAAMLYIGIVSDIIPEGKAVRIGVGSVIRKVIPKPLRAGWGLTKIHLEKHFFGNNATALKNIDPQGNADKWAQHLAELFNSPVTKTTGNGMLDIVKEFPKASGSGTFKMGIRLSPNADGTFDLVTVLTDQTKF
jgi:hypothetical protein